MVELLKISAYPWKLGENLKSKLRIYYLSYVKYFENDKLIIFCSTPEWYSGSVLEESPFRLKIDGELNVIIINMSISLMELAVNRKH